MKHFTIKEKLWHCQEKITEPLFSKIRKKMLNNTDFTIISNNCWGGRCYEYFGIRKNSPTVGSYIYSDDYIKLIKNLKDYMRKELVIITSQESSHYDWLVADGHADVPIGRLGDVEIVFVHYKNPEIAKKKWDARVKRINWDNIIIKFSYMCRCNDDCIELFKRIKNIKKVAFVPQRCKKEDGLILVPSKIGRDDDIGDDVYVFNEFINIVDFINQPITGINEMIIE